MFSYCVNVHVKAKKEEKKMNAQNTMIANVYIIKLLNILKILFVSVTLQYLL
jgi:hypothetical protein